MRTASLEKALLAFLVFTFVQSYDFNLERLHRLAKGLSLPEGPKDRETLGLRLFRGLYALLFAPQDRAIVALERFLQGRLRLDPSRFWDEGALAGVVNLGLTTQLFFLGVFLLFHEPGAYLTFVLLQAVYLGLWYLWRIARSIPSPR